ncbi:MAG TPA: hypothetical protein VMA77_14595 [Solirubrobacteraceae bacterium]|nr:hypothetical protein [Solirubrobacteraceae bacterium]
MRHFKSHWSVLLILVLASLAVVSATRGAQRVKTDGSVAAGAVTETYTYRGEVAQKVAVPAGVDAARVRAVGGRGASVGDYAGGGYGAQVRGTIHVTPGQVLTLRVGGRGSGSGSGHGGAGGWGATGYGGRGGNSTVSVGGGGGGGATGIEIAGCGTCTASAVLTAGGGGGAGGRGMEPSIDRGGHGGSGAATAEHGQDGHGPGAGKGGTGAGQGEPSDGGAGGTGTSWGGGGGGGGAGATGGRGGSGGGTGAGGGGGGGAGSPAYTSKLTDAKVGGGVTNDGNGVVELTWVAARQSCPSQIVQVPADSNGAAVQLRCDGTVPPAYFTLVGPPSHGTIENLDSHKGTFTYVPAAGYNGVDYVAFYAVSAGVHGPMAEVFFNVGPGPRRASALGR